MFTPTKVQVHFIKTTLDEILSDNTSGAWARAWLVWAEFHLQTLSYGNKTDVVARLMPLVMACVATSDKTPEQAQAILHDSIVRTLFQAKVDGRDSLDMAYARKAVIYVRGKCER